MTKIIILIYFTDNHINLLEITINIKIEQTLLSQSIKTTLLIILALSYLKLNNRKNQHPLTISVIN